MNVMRKMGGWGREEWMGGDWVMERNECDEKNGGWGREECDGWRGKV